MKRLTTLLSVLAVVAFFLACGCAHVSDVTYPDESSIPPVQKKVRILTNYDDKRNLAIALALPTTNSAPVSVSQPESSLTDGEGRHYRLTFVSGADRAFLPKQAQHCTSSASIAYAYPEDLQPSSGASSEAAPTIAFVETADASGGLPPAECAC